MAGATKALPAALLPGPRVDGQSESLQSILGRIYDERGHFRHITEETLQAEIAADDAQDTSSDTDEEEDETGESDAIDSKSRREQLYAAKAEMLAHIASAQNEALMGLDAISLILSKDAPKQAELTMSPYLKQHIQPGTLGLDMWDEQRMQKDPEQEKIDAVISGSWKMQSLQACADSLLGAATRLEKTVRRETQYWENVLSVSERGWSICRMPREKHNLGVRFGFLEALGEYRDRGLAALRSDESGNVVLDKGFGNNSKYIRVRTQRGGKTVGISRAPAVTAESGTTLETRIHAARDSLYEEELFYEMIRESRTLASYRVEMQQSTIRLPTRLDAKPESADSNFDSVSIELVSSDEMDDSETAGLQQDHWAQALAVMFRLMLSFTHRERLKRRSGIPQAMSLKRPDIPVAHILRPVLTVLHHLSISRDMDRYLERLNALLGSASIEASVKTARFNPTVLVQAGSMDSLMQKVMTPIHSQSSLSLKGPHFDQTLVFGLHLHTSNSVPALGSRIQVRSPVGLPEMEVYDTEELVEYLNAMLGNALGLGIAASLPGWIHNERLGTVSNHGSGRKVSVVIESGLDEADEGQMILDTGVTRVEWTCGSKGKDERRFWDVVEDIQ